MIVGLMIAGFILLLLMGVPIYAALSLASIAALVFIEGWMGIDQVADIVFSRLDTYMFVAIPLFSLMAHILSKTDAVTDLYSGIQRLSRRFTGSVGIATIGVATVFSSISGSSVATSMTLSQVSIPPMLRHGYSKRAAYGLVAAGGTLGILIPPSIALIIYGVLADVSIAGLFIGALLPALLLVMLFSLFTIFQQRHAAKNTVATETNEDLPADNALKAPSFRLFFVIALPVAVMTGLYSGAFTPTEAGAAGAVGAMLLAALVYQSFSIKSLNESAQRSAQTSCMVFSIIVGAALFSHVMVVTEFPTLLVSIIVSWQLDELTFLFGVMFIILLLGMLLDGAAILLVTTPIVLPLLDQYGIDRVWYGILLVINLEMSLISPPVGLNLMVIKGAANADIKDVIIGALPYVLLMMVALALIIVFPGIALYLPGQL